jgi:hypothetical protein
MARDDASDGDANGDGGERVVNVGDMVVAVVVVVVVIVVRGDVLLSRLSGKGGDWSTDEMVAVGVPSAVDSVEAGAEAAAALVPYTQGILLQGDGGDVLL